LKKSQLLAWMKKEKGCRDGGAIPSSSGLLGAERTDQPGGGGGAVPGANAAVVSGEHASIVKDPLQNDGSGAAGDGSRIGGAGVELPLMLLNWIKRGGGKKPARDVGAAGGTVDLTGKSGRGDADEAEDIRLLAAVRERALELDEEERQRRLREWEWSEVPRDTSLSSRGRVCKKALHLPTSAVDALDRASGDGGADDSAFSVDAAAMEEAWQSLAVGHTVVVASRTGPGENNPGGVGRVRKVHREEADGGTEGGTAGGGTGGGTAGGTIVGFDVRYVLGGSEKNVPKRFVRPKDLGLNASVGGSGGGAKHEAEKRKRAVVAAEDAREEVRLQSLSEEPGAPASQLVPQAEVADTSLVIAVDAGPTALDAGPTALDAGPTALAMGVSTGPAGPTAPAMGVSTGPATATASLPASDVAVATAPPLHTATSDGGGASLCLPASVHAWLLAALVLEQPPGMLAAGMPGMPPGIPPGMPPTGTAPQTVVICKKCPKVALAKNYGFCQDHRTSRAVTDVALVADALSPQNEAGKDHTTDQGTDQGTAQPTVDASPPKRGRGRPPKSPAVDGEKSSTVLTAEGEEQGRAPQQQWCCTAEEQQRFESATVTTATASGTVAASNNSNADGASSLGKLDSEYRLDAAALSEYQQQQYLRRYQQYRYLVVTADGKLIAPRHTKGSKRGAKPTWGESWTSRLQASGCYYTGAPTGGIVPRAEHGVSMPKKGPGKSSGTTLMGMWRKKGLVAPAPVVTSIVNMDWVQCDECDKWRSVPTSAVPTLAKKAVWTCAVNEWELDLEKRSCDAPQDPRHSAYQGVSFDQESGKFEAHIELGMLSSAAVGGSENASKPKRRFLGLFDSDLEAARAYDTAAKRHHGEHAVLNFEAAPVAAAAAGVTGLELSALCGEV
jgi:hypothetical protein